MKILLLTLCTIIAINGYSQSQQYDSWQKRDTATVKQPQSNTLKDSLPGNTELKMLPAKTVKSPQQSPIRIIQDTTTNKIYYETYSNIEYNARKFKKSIESTAFRSPVPNRFTGHWSGFYYGFINTATNGYSMYAPEYKNFMDLDWAGSFNLQFNFIQHSIGLSSRNNMGLVVGLGFDYQRLKFSDKTMTVTTQDGKLMPLPLESLEIYNIRRSTYKTLYLSIPLLYEIQFPSRYKHNMYLSAGIVGGIRMHSKTKVVYDDHGKHKRKEKDSFNMIPFKADATVRIGYRSVFAYGSYTLTHLFKGDHGPELNLYTVGLGLSFVLKKGG